MDLKREYTKFYQHWLKEFEEANLTRLKQVDFKDYNKLLADITSFQVDKNDKIQFQLIESYKININFLFNDLLEIRKNKIIGAALANQEVNLEDLLESERFLYQNLISTFKGYEKVKNLSLGENHYTLEEIFDKTIKPTVLDNEFDLEKAEEIESKELKLLKEAKIKEREVSYNYTLIRFLKKAEAIVGIDLINYGPFEKNDVANLPDKNAVIFINEKVAEKIDIS
ncbi:MAG: hypothetical protein ACFFBY_08345 [Promethearchaeota archaeon]